MVTQRINCSRTEFVNPSDAPWSVGGGTGDVVGPSSATDNAIARFDLTSGKLIQSSSVTLSDAGNLAGVGTLNTHTIPGGTGTLALTSQITGINSGTNTGDQTISLTGDVTGSGTGSFPATIGNDKVTYAKMQNVSAASKLVGRGSAAGAGDPEEISIGSGLSMTGTTLSATGGAGSTWTEVEIDFGSGKGEWSKEFTVVDAGVSPTSKIIIGESGKVATGRASGDQLWDQLHLSALPGTGQFTVLALAVPGPVAGARKIHYSIAA